MKYWLKPCKIKRCLTVLCICCTMSFMCGCSVLGIALNTTRAVASLENQEEKYVIDYYDIVVTAEGYWEDVTEGKPFDLQLHDGSSYYSVMAYKYIDLSEGQTPEDIYHWHNSDIMSKRDNVKQFSLDLFTQMDDKCITKNEYLADYNGNRNFYMSYLVDFKEEETFAWILVTATPTTLMKNNDKYEAMVKNVSINKNN